PSQQSNPSPTKLTPMETKADAGPNSSAKDEDFYQGKPASFWLNQLRDSDAKYRAEAVRAMGSIAKSNKSYIPILVNSLNGSDEVVGYAASQALAGLGAEVMPILLEIMNNPKSADARRRAIVAVGLMGQPAGDAVALVEHALRSDD